MSLQPPIKDTVGRHILRNYAFIIDENAYPKDRPFYFILIPHFCEPSSVIEITIFSDHELVQLRRIFERGMQELFHTARGDDGINRNETHRIVEKLSGRWPAIHPASPHSAGAVRCKRVGFAERYQPERSSAWFVIGVILGGESRSELWRRGGEQGVIFEESPTDPLVAEARKRLWVMAKELEGPKATLDAWKPEQERKRRIGSFIIKPRVNEGTKFANRKHTQTGVSSVTAKQENGAEGEGDATLIGTPVIPPTA